MPGRVPLMAAGSRRALGDIGNQLGGGLTSRNSAKDQPIKYVVARASSCVIARRTSPRTLGLIFFPFSPRLRSVRAILFIFPLQRWASDSHIHPRYNPQGKCV